jgi:uncharacterized NAD-dependent epimerase/dehydratase family protein
MKTATILARGYFASSRAKTAHGLIRHGKRFKIISVIDETLEGKDAGEVMGVGHRGIPLVSDVDTNAEVMIIGVAPSGGQLPPEWREDIKTAIKSGLDVISGLHDFLNEDTEFVSLANKHTVSLIDIRKPPDKIYMAQNIKPTVPVILVSGTDGRCGKRTTAIELYNAALGRGIKAGFIATGQTGIMIGCDAGVAVDHLPTDFVAGAIEHAIQQLIEIGKEMIIVEGQGALLHHAYSTSTIGILYGAWPRFIILAHPPLRERRKSFPNIPMPEPEDEIRALNVLLPDVKVIALSLNCDGAKNYRELCKKFEEQTGLLSIDVIADPNGSDKLLDKILNELKH